MKKCWIAAGMLEAERSFRRLMRMCRFVLKFVVQAIRHEPQGHGAQSCEGMQSIRDAGRGESWARTAVELGYYDEAHMIDEIRRSEHHTASDARRTAPVIAPAAIVYHHG